MSWFTIKRWSRDVFRWGDAIDPVYLKFVLTLQQPLWETRQSTVSQWSFHSMFMEEIWNVFWMSVRNTWSSGGGNDLVEWAYEGPSGVELSSFRHFLFSVRAVVLWAGGISERDFLYVWLSVWVSAVALPGLSWSWRHVELISVFSPSTDIHACAGRWSEIFPHINAC